MYNRADMITHGTAFVNQSAAFAGQVSNMLIEFRLSKNKWIVMGLNMDSLLDMLTHRDVKHDAISLPCKIVVKIYKV